MFRSHPGWRSAARQTVFALLPVVIGAGVLVAGVDRPAPAPGMTRLEATQSAMPPLLVDASPAAVDVPASGAGAGEAAVAGVGPAPDTTVYRPAEGVAAVAVEAPAPAAGTSEGGSSAAAPVQAATPAATGGPDTSVPATTSTSTTLTTTTTTTAPAPAPARSGRARDAEAEVVPLTNEDRAAAGLGSLSRNGCLDAAAAGFAEQMARTGVLAHNPGAGAAASNCRSNATWGDNVGMSTACDVARLEREWMASPSHRRNILTGAFTVIGVGAWTDETGTCWVQVLFSS